MVGKIFTREKRDKKEFEDLLDIIHFLEKVSTKIYGLRDEGKIFEAILDEFKASPKYSTTIFFLTKDRKAVKVRGTSNDPTRVQKVAELFGVTAEKFMARLDESEFFRRIVDGETLQMLVEDILKPVLPKNVPLGVAKVLGISKAKTIGTPLYVDGEIFGALLVSSTGLFDYFVPAVQNFGLHIASALELARKNMKLVKAREAAEKSKQVKNDFLANITHELRSPLHSIIGVTELIMQTELTGEQKKYVGFLGGSSKALLRGIDDLLGLTLYESGESTLEEVEFELEGSLENLITSMKQMAEEKNLKFEYRLDPDIPDGLIGDPLRLNQILANLIVNAIKFTNEGIVEVNVSLDRESDGNVVVVFTVKDTGMGIESDQLGYIFESFAQVKRKDGMKHSGFGLGLAIVKRLVELQDGEISVQSKPGKGSVFEVKLKFKKAVGVKRRKVPAAAEQALQGVHVLLVEDNDLNRLVARGILENEGALVEEAVDGREAVKRIKKSKKQENKQQKGKEQMDGGIDVVLMDLQMPVMDGFQTIEHVRDELKNDELKIVAVTAYDLAEERKKAFSCGVDAYITKPFRKEELVDTILGL